MIAHYALIIPEFLQNMDDTHSFELVLDTLTATRRIYRAAASDASLSREIARDVQSALELIMKALNHEYAKIIAEGLRVTASLIFALESTINTTSKGVVAPVFAAVLEKLRKSDIDQEVKQSSLISIAGIASVAHQQIGAAGLADMVKLFVERLDSELTRDSALKGFTSMASAKERMAFPGLPEIMDKLLLLLRKNQRSLHIITFEAIIAFLSRYEQDFIQMTPVILNEIKPFLNE